MPSYCSAYGCSHERNAKTKKDGITFHKFPKDKRRRKQWETALRWKKFSAGDSTTLCSAHFRPEDFDRTGQTVRLREGVVPSVFSFPAHLQRRVATRTSQTSKKALESLSVERPPVQKAVQKAVPLPLPVPTVDHSYALPSSPDELKARLSEALARVESLEKEKRNAKERERRAKNSVCVLLKGLREKKFV